MRTYRNRSALSDWRIWSMARLCKFEDLLLICNVSERRAMSVCFARPGAGTRCTGFLRPVGTAGPLVTRYSPSPCELKNRGESAS